MVKEISFEITGKAIVTDPAYKIGVWCQAIIDGIKPGIYVARKEGNHFTVMHKDHLNTKVSWALPDHEIGVDQCILGVYDFNMFKQTSETGSTGQIIGASVTVPDGTYFLSLASYAGETVGFGFRIK